MRESASACEGAGHPQEKQPAVMCASIYAVKRTMVYLPEEADLQLERLARQTKRSKADLLREALDRYLAEQRTAQLPSWVGIGSSDDPSYIERDEELLPQLIEEATSRGSKRGRS